MSHPIRVEMRLGDCLQILRDFAPNSITLVAADLPYGITVAKWDTPIDLSMLWPELRRVTVVDGTFAFNAQQPFLTTLISSNKPQFRYDLVWQKNRMSGYLSAKRAPLRAHESIAIFGKTRTYHPQMRFVAKPTVKVSAGRSPNISKTTGVICVNKTVGQTRYPISILPFDREDKRNGTQHPTQKPVALLEYLIQTYTSVGDTVLDPCAGSFTTAVACVRTGRNFVGVELDPSYFASGVERVRAQIRASGVKAEVVVYDKPKMSQAS